MELSSSVYGFSFSLVSICMHNIFHGGKLPILVRDSGRTHLFRNVLFMQRCCFYRLNWISYVSQKLAFLRCEQKSVRSQLFPCIMNRWDCFCIWLFPPHARICFGRGIFKDTGVVSIERVASEGKWEAVLDGPKSGFQLWLALLSTHALQSHHGPFFFLPTHGPSTPFEGWGMNKAFFLIQSKCIGKLVWNG